MLIAQRLDEIGKPAWIALMVLSFFVFWPLGLAILAFLIWSGRMGCHYGSNDRWNRKMERLQQKMDRARDAMNAYGQYSRGPFWGGTPSSGNRAFDEYRSETIKRLEEEQQEFRDFLERLRFAKDKTEFDQFMTERRDRPAPQAPQGNNFPQGPSPQAQ
jgi:hypothetical protein